MRQVGVFGGTFDPPHIGHLITAESVCEALTLDCIIWVPAADQPLKTDWESSPIECRVEMVQRAIADNPAFSLSLLDAERPGPHYTVDTLRMLAGQMPDTRFTLIIGSDSLRDLPRWDRPQELVELATLAVVNRPGVVYDLSELSQQIPGLEQCIKTIDMPQIGLSATDIRQWCAMGRSVRYLVVPAVAEFIEERGLYRDPVEKA